MYEGTIRVPDEKKQKVRYYSDVEIDLGNMEKWLAGLGELTTSQFYQQDEALVEELEGVFNKRLQKELVK